MYESFDDSNFLLTYPLWFPIHRTHRTREPIIVTGSNGERGAPLLTDYDLYIRFTNALPDFGDYLPHKILDALDLAKLAGLMEHAGVTHFAIDPDTKRARFFPLGEFPNILHPPPDES